MSFAKNSHTTYKGITDNQFVDETTLTNLSYDSKSVVTSVSESGAQPVLVSFQDLEKRLSFEDRWPTMNRSVTLDFFKSLKNKFRRGSQYEVKF